MFLYGAIKATKNVKQAFKNTKKNPDLNTATYLSIYIKKPQL